MSTYEDLNESFERLLKSTSQFIPMAFHLHSPGSYDWGARQHADPTRNGKARFDGDAGIDEFPDELAKEFKMVCITDHMKLDNASCKLAKASLRRGDIRVCPGMEVNIMIPPAGNQRIHLLVVSPSEKDIAAIERIFAEQGDFPTDAHRTGNEDPGIG